MYLFKQVFNGMLNNINKEESESMAFKTTETIYEICPGCSQAQHKIAELEKEIDEINEEYNKQEKLIEAMSQYLINIGCQYCPALNNDCGATFEFDDDRSDEECRRSVKNWFIKQMEGEK